jgi:uncharacterized membrane protein YozB (DUF420 family)
MSNDRTALVIIAVLGFAFVIAIFERLKEPLPQMGGLTTGGQVAGIVYALGALLLVAGGVAVWRRNAPGDFMRVAAIWVAVFALVALLIAFVTGGLSTSPESLSL